jgi:hypothetical protein
LPVNSDVEASQWQSGKIAFPLSRKRKTLPVNKIDLPIESRHADSFNLANATERHLVDEKTENNSIFVGLSVPDRRGRSGNECSAARLATIAYRTCFCPSERVIVSLALLCIYIGVIVVRAGMVWAGRDSYGIKRLPKTAQLFMDGFVTLYRWILAAKTAPKHGRAPA